MFDATRNKRHTKSWMGLATKDIQRVGWDVNDMLNTLRLWMEVWIETREGRRMDAAGDSPGCRWG